MRMWCWCSIAATSSSAARSTNSWRARDSSTRSICRSSGARCRPRGHPPATTVTCEALRFTPKAGEGGPAVAPWPVRSSYGRVTVGAAFLLAWGSPRPPNASHLRTTIWIMASDLTYRVSRAILPLSSRAMLQLDVVWKSPPPEGPVILAANHPSCTDPFLLPLMFRRPIRLLITQNAFQVPGFGSFLRHLGHVPVVRREGLPPPA